MKTSTFKMLALLLTIFSLSCSKDETAEQSLTGENGGQVSRFQLVTIDFGSNTVPNDTYEGTFNNEPVTLSKIEDNKLLFYVNESTPLGQTQLLIPALNNTKIIYEVVEATLTQSPEATLQPLMDYQAQYGATLTNTPEDAPFLQNHNAFTQYFANLSDDDRIIAAKFYNTNKAIFDPVYTTNYDAIQGRMTNQTQADFDFQLYRSLIAKHAFSVFATAAAATAAAKVRPYGVHTVVLVTVAGAGIYKSIDFYDQIITDVFRVIGVKIDNILGLNNRMANAPNTTLTLTDNQATTLPFVVNGRNFTNTDSNVQKEYVQTFFTAKNKLNDFINDLNTAINWINNNVPLLTLSTITTVEVPATVASNSFDTNAQVMQGFTFSVNHPNLSLENATLQSDGQLNLKVKFVGNPSATTINSTLNYTYNDDFSSFSGSFPLMISAESVCGDVIDIDGNVYESVTIGTQCWMKSNLNVSRYRNGDVIPQVTSQEAWAELTTGAWCYYENNTANGTVYGKLYNWYAVTDPRGLAPEGYHVPSDAEWTILVDFLGGETVAGGKMKSQSGWITGWGTGDNGTNSSGFNSKPAGRRFSGGAFDYHGTSYWSTTDYVNVQWNVEGAYNREIPSSGLTIVKFGNVKSEGYSIRCLKD